MHLMRCVPALASMMLLLAVGSCAVDESLSPRPPALSDVRVEANELNALSVHLHFTVSDADSARVIIWSRGNSNLTTPFSHVGDGTTTLTVLGLLPETRYEFVIDAIGSGGAVASPVMIYEVGSLPEALRQVRIETMGQSLGGLSLLSLFIDPIAYALVFDDNGRIRWYREFSGTDGSAETKQHENGNITVFLGSTPGFFPLRGRFVEVAPDGELIRTIEAPEPLYTDNHELLLTFDGGRSPTAHFFSYDFRQTDLTAIGGAADVQLAGHQILRVLESNETELVFNGWDHFGPEEAIELPQTAWQLSNIDFDHPNSLAFDLDGHYIASWRHLAEVTKIHYETGEIIWRLGGVNNEFTFVADPLGGFSAQHAATILDNGNLLLYDNGNRHDPPESRAVEYHLDVENKVATLVWEYRHDPPIFTGTRGSVQRLRDGSTLVGFAAAGVIAYVAPDGTVLGEGRLQLGESAGAFYRVTRIASLYEFARP